MKKTFFAILIIKFCLAIFYTNNTYALFVIPEEDRVDETKYEDLTKVYSDYIPDTLKIKTKEDKEKYLKGKNASCLIKIKTRKIPRKLPPIKKINKIDKENKISPITAYLIKFSIISIIIMLSSLVLLLKTRDF